MIKTINVEPIKYREKYLSTPLLTKAEVEKAMDYVVAQTRPTWTISEPSSPGPPPRA